MSLYPLRFEPIFKSMLWGGRRLPAFLNREPPHSDPIGEAWVISDVEGNPSRVIGGPLSGITLRELLDRDPVSILGPVPAPQGRFPLLLKFIDSRQELSVQVHPNDEQAAKSGHGMFGKTEAWVIMEMSPDTSKVYAGVREGVTADLFRTALREKTTPGLLHSFTPQPGDCVFLEAGTVHAIGANILLFEVQQTSDITYRLYDWDRVDAKSGKPRQLHVEEGLACVGFGRGPCPPVRPITTMNEGVYQEGLVDCRYFFLQRRRSRLPFRVGLPGRCRAVVCVAGSGELESRGQRYLISKGDVLLLPAEVGQCLCIPSGSGEIVILECGLPDV
jgi:mannose-6-phosphate isomerase